MSKERNKLRDAKRFKNVKELMLNTVELYGDNIAYVTKVKKDKENVQYINHTYKDLLNDIYCFGTGLYKLGLKNSRVAVCGRNRYEWVVSHVSNLFGGIVSVPIDKELQLNELEESLIRSGVEALIFDEKYQEKIAWSIYAGIQNYFTTK